MNILKISNKPPLILAPMAGVADSAFRILCKKQGADIVFSEMISAKAVYYGDKKTYALPKTVICLPRTAHRPRTGFFSLSHFLGNS